MSLPVCEATHPETGERCSLRHLPEAEPSHYTRNGGSWPNEHWTPPPTRSATRSRSVRSVVREVDRSVREEARRPVDASTLALSGSHPDTSFAMRERVFPKTGSQRRRAFDFISARGAVGATDDELEVALDLLHQSASATRNSLMKDGWIIDSGQRRLTRSGHEAIVWVIAP